MTLPRRYHKLQSERDATAAVVFALITHMPKAAPDAVCTL